MPADLAIVGARVRTLDPAQAVRERRSRSSAGTISRSATTPRSRAHGAYRGDRRRRAALIPGLVDSHLHPFWGAELARGTDLSHCTTARGGAGGAGRQHSAAAAGCSPGAWTTTRRHPAEIADGGRRCGGVRPALRPAHRAGDPARPASSRRSTGARLRGRSSAVVCVDGVPTGELRELGARSCPARRARPALAGDPRPPRARAAATERARAHGRARDGRRARDDRPAARSRRHRTN